jgi:hypothetical protein
MKKLLTLLLLSITLSNYAQITLENKYPSGGVLSDYLRLVKLSSSGYKYAIHDANKITLYNLNHVVFKTITYPAIPGRNTTFRPWILYLSEELFNTNPADIEYFISYADMGSVNHCAVYDELGSLLFLKDSANNINTGTATYNENFITATTSGTKMIISQAQAPNYATVYSLPGTLTCHDCTNGTVTSIKTNNSASGTNTERISNYPNPTAGQTTIEYNLPQGSTTADLVFYNMTGVEVKRFKVTNAFRDILISTADLDAGTYYYQLQTAEGFKAGKKMVVVK